MTKQFQSLFETHNDMITAEKKQFLTEKAREIRRLTLKCIGSIGIGHVGGSLSIAELLAVLYFDKMRIRPDEPDWKERDKLVLSKGHAGPALYSTLALCGYFSTELLYTLNKPGTSLPSHCDMRKTPGIDMTTGSLGQGASSAVGLALAQKLDGTDARTFVIFGDGEIQEGQVWEAMLFAAHRNLENLTAIIDYNNMQIDGTTDEICSLRILPEKFKAFGITPYETDGHDPEALSAALDMAIIDKKPSVVIMHTVKGHGVSEFEGKRSSHNAVVTEEILEKCLGELA